MQALEVGSTLTFIARNSGALELGVWDVSWEWGVSMGFMATGGHVTVDTNSSQLEEGQSRQTPPPLGQV